MTASLPPKPPAPPPSSSFAARPIAPLPARPFAPAPPVAPLAPFAVRPHASVPVITPLPPAAPAAAAAVPSLVSPADFELVRKLVRERSGIVIEPRQEYLVETRLKTVARRRNLEKLGQLFDQLRLGSDPKLATEVVEALTTNETSFFRDFEPFEALKGCVLPELLRARASKRTLRIWSAASSSGQEAYSLLMMMRAGFPQLAVWKLELLGTDLSAEMVRRAKAATYTSFEVRRGMADAQTSKWLEPVGDDFRVKDELRKLVDFREMNLVAPFPPMATYDLVLLRNVLIYFDVETKRQILKKIRSVLAPDGVLMIGASESLLGVDESWKTVRVGRATTYKP